MKTFFKNLWNDESGQGMTEYILLLVILIAIIALFKEDITTIVQEKIAQLSSQMGEI